VFGSLNAAGLSAAGDIALNGLAADTTPPDTTGAIGPNDYVEFVNNEVAAYTRASLSPDGSPVSLSTFTNGVEVCDPQIKYDPQTQRWFYAAIRCDGTTTQNTMYLGFSKTSEPTPLSASGWCRYGVGFGAAFEDYPKLGLDAQHIIVGTNSFKSNSPFTFFTAHIFSAPKPAAGPLESCPSLALTGFGSAGVPLKSSLGNKASTPEPATVADGSPNGYVVSADEVTPFSGSGKNIMIWQVTGTAAAPTLTLVGAPAVPAFTLPPQVPQPGSTDEIDSLDSRLTQAVAAADPNAGGAEAVWTQHTVAGGAGSVVRWYELIPSTVSVKQTGAVSDPTTFVFNGAIAPTLSGGAVLDYNTGGDAALVQIMAQSRIGSAPFGTMNTPITLGSSTDVDSDFACPSQPLGKEIGAESCRWGDYAGASVDPTNGNVVWGSNQINGPATIEHDAQWTTRNFALTPDDLAPLASFAASPNPATAGSAVGFDGTSSSDPDGSIASFSWSFGDGTTAGGATLSHAFGVAGTYTVTLIVTDNGGGTNAASHQILVSAATTASTPTTGTTSTPTGAGAALANSRFQSPHVHLNAKTGVLTFTTTVANPGTLSWRATFQNGKFGAFSSASKCKTGFIRLGGKCRPAKIVFAKGSKAVGAAGRVSVTLKPSASGRKALKNALKHKKGVPVTIVFSFKSSLGGGAVSHTQSVMVKLKK
jgi:chitodextrinase